LRSWRLFPLRPTAFNALHSISIHSNLSSTLLGSWWRLTQEGD
jgi:hypothetical protein